jgi:hypothetical protein
MSQLLDIADREDRQRLRRAFCSDGGFEGVRIVLSAIVSDQDQLTLLARLPD